MRIPGQPAVKELKHLSPSLYEVVLACKARAAWVAFGEREAVPQHPTALLGTCVHAVVEDAHNGGLSRGAHESRPAEPREIFDRKARELYERAHPLIRAKFAAPERVPYYHLFRERAALVATEAAAHRQTTRPGAGVASQGAQAERTGLVETTLRSRDGLLLGRPDYLDVSAGVVVDYKTGAGPDGDPAGLRSSEARQLRLYVHLANEAGLALNKGAVVRSNGRRVELDVSEADAVAEGQRAREALRAFNARAAEGFEHLAEPSPDSCRYCPCIPFCKPFWEKATADWADQCGTHVEGTISSVSRATVQNTALITFEMAVTRGTTAPRPTVVQQLPETWACADGTPPPEAGDIVRVTNGRLGEDTEGAAVIRPDRVTTALWTVRRATPVDRGAIAIAESSGVGHG